MSVKKIYFIAILFLAIVLLGIVGITSWYTVDESEQAKVLTFGELEEGIIGPGLHFKLPWPIQEVKKLPRETFSLHFGNNPQDGEGTNNTSQNIKMITGDENIVLADLVVQWKITDPGQYLYNSANPKQILYNATSASLRGVIGSSKIDDALTSGKAQIENDVRELLTTLVKDYKIGISIINVKLQNVDLPNEEVRQAFTRVTDARETMNTKINEAKKYANKRKNEAQGEKAAIMSAAEGDKTARIEQARGDVAQFNALLNAYQKQPNITRERLILETLDQVLPNAQMYIMNEEGGTVKYLPIRTIDAGNIPKLSQKGSEKNE